MLFLFWFSGKQHIYIFENSHIDEETMISSSFCGLAAGFVQRYKMFKLWTKMKLQFLEKSNWNRTTIKNHSAHPNFSYIFFAKPISVYFLFYLGTLSSGFVLVLWLCYFQFQFLSCIRIYFGYNCSKSIKVFVLMSNVQRLQMCAKFKV